jgi:thiol-disulfide isomerase/thioredoxin
LRQINRRRKIKLMNRRSILAFIVTAWLSGVTVEAQVPGPAGAVPAVTPSSANATGLDWLTDLPAALSRAKAEGKSVLFFFHGSDWCPPCVELQKQVLDTPEFFQYARRALVLVDVDFPQKTTQSDALKQANLALKAKFNLSLEAGGSTRCAVR